MSAAFKRLLVFSAVGELRQTELLSVLPLALVCAGVAIVIMRSVTLIEIGFRKTGLPTFLHPTIGGVILSGLAYLNPHVLSAGHGARVGVKVGAEQIEADLARPVELPDLPKAPDALAAELLSALRSEGKPVEPAEIARRFRDGRGKRSRNRIEQTLRVLSVAGSVQRTPAGWFAPRRAG